MASAQPALPDDAQPDDVRRILDTARSPDHPREWFVWPLRHNIVIRAIVGWAITGAVGLLLFIPAIFVTIPGNFQHTGTGLIIFTVILLLVLGAVGIGGLALCLGDLWRLAHADQYLLVMTPDDFVKLTPRRTIHVPMVSVAYVTLKGVKPPPNPDVERSVSRTMLMMRGYGSVMGNVMGIPGTSRREFNRPPSLAFLDRRTNREVVVATDDAFDQLNVLEEILSLYAGGRSRTRTGAR